MNVQLILLSLAAVAVLVVLPAVMVWGAIDHFRHKGSDRKSGGGVSNAVAGAMLELDRFVRPSAEHQIQAEQQTQPREDDKGGE